MIVCPFSNLSRYAAIIPGLEEAVKVASEITDFTNRVIPLSGGNRILVQQGTTQPPEGQLSEAHRQYLDVQYIVEGVDTIGWAPTDTLTISGEFDEVKDRGMYEGPVDFIAVKAGYCYVVFPEDAHMPNCHLEGDPVPFTKLVLKLKV